MMGDDEDGGLGCIGSMFDTASSRSVVRVQLTKPDDSAIDIELRCIDGEPGHVQSGQYIWPAAESLSKYLCAHWDELTSHTVIELGAGCGMAGIAAAQLGGPSTSVVFTDHDPGAVSLLEENVEINGVDSRSLSMQLEWGESLPASLVEALTRAPADNQNGPVLVIGSDLLYCAGVVRPLMKTVHEILVAHCRSSAGKTGKFVLVSSFDTGEDVEAEILALSTELNFSVAEVAALDVASSICRTQIFTFSAAAATTEKVGYAVDEDIYAARYSHMDFFSLRDFSLVPIFWRAVLRAENVCGVPPCVIGDSGSYDVTDLQEIHLSGASEYISEDPRFRRHTFALKVGYVGTEFLGFQDQKSNDVKTVEGELKSALEQKFSCAGRTDKNVSAISQVLSFHTFDQSITEKSIVEKFKASRVHAEGNIRLLKCWRMPREFNALYCATWRRYIYMFPLNIKSYTPVVHEPITDPRSSGVNFGWHPVEIGSKTYLVDVDVATVNLLLQELEDKELPYDAYAYRDKRCGGETKDMCTLFKARATAVDVSRWVPSNSGEPNLFLAIELVGNRFLRKMVRILSGTAIRESTTIGSDVSYSALVDIALSSDRLRASAALPGEGLCMCGVGYELLSKKPSKTQRPKSTSCAETAQSISVRKQRKERKKRSHQEISGVSSDRTNSAGSSLCPLRSEVDRADASI